MLYRYLEWFIKNFMNSRGHTIRLCTLLYCLPIYRLMLWYTY